MATQSYNPSKTPPRELNAWLRLAHTPGLGGADRLALLQAFGLPENIFRASPDELASRFNRRLASALGTPPATLNAACELALRWHESPAHHLITLADPAYPRPLLELSDPPVLLYVRAHSLACLEAPSLAIVGSRNATTQGKANARAFAKDLADRQLVVSSGLALGIDACAHQGALAATAGHTVAVIGTGIDRIYPAVHARLADQIAERGALISELPLGAPPLKHHFPRRNRLLAGLSVGVLVVEAARQSGSLITARLCLENGRDVFAIPGSIHSPVSKGCHWLIREGAKLVESANDILEELPATPRISRANAGNTRLEPSPSNHGADPDEIWLNATLGWDPIGMEALLNASGLSIQALSDKLLSFELAGRIERLADGRFMQIRTP